VPSHPWGFVVESARRYECRSVQSAQEYIMYLDTDAQMCCLEVLSELEPTIYCKIGERLTALNHTGHSLPVWFSVAKEYKLFHSMCSLASQVGLQSFVAYVYSNDFCTQCYTRDVKEPHLRELTLTISRHCSVLIKLVANYSIVTFTT